MDIALRNGCFLAQKIGISCIVDIKDRVTIRATTGNVSFFPFCF
jgi:hypothetical protein